MINLNEFYAQYSADPERAELKMVHAAADKMLDAVESGYYSFKNIKDLNYREICNWLNWPYFRDNSLNIRESINIAANVVCEILGYKPQHIDPRNIIPLEA